MSSTRVEVPEQLAPPSGPQPPAERVAGLWSDAWLELRRRPMFWISASLIAVLLLIAIFPGLFSRGIDPRDCHLKVDYEGERVNNFLLRPPYVAQPDMLDLPVPDAIRAGHWFGTDLFGCDYYAMTIHSTRNSIVVGLSVTAGIVLVGLLLGSIAGYFGGVVDSLIARVTDVVLAIPTVLGGIVLLSLVRPRDRGVALVVGVLVLLAWPTVVRLVRGSVLSVKELEYVDAARALGAPTRRIIWRHVLPNALAPALVYAATTVGVIITAEAAVLGSDAQHRPGLDHPGSSPPVVSGDLPFHNRVRLHPAG